MAPPVRRHHPGSDGDEIAAAIQEFRLVSIFVTASAGPVTSDGELRARVSWQFRLGMRDPPTERKGQQNKRWYAQSNLLACRSAGVADRQWLS